MAAEYFGIWRPFGTTGVAVTGTNTYLPSSNLPAGSTASSTNFSSLATPRARTIGVHLILTAGASGTAFVEQSNDPQAAQPATASSAAWVSVANGLTGIVFTSGVVTGADLNGYIVNITNSMQYLRIRYVNSAGSGTFNCFVSQIG